MSEYDFRTEENCSRCGRPYGEHPHGPGDWSQLAIAMPHAFRRQPRSEHYPNAVDSLKTWSDPRFWPDGRWD